MLDAQSFYHFNYICKVQVFASVGLLTRAKSAEFSGTRVPPYFLFRIYQHRRRGAKCSWGANGSCPKKIFKYGRGGMYVTL